MKRSLSRSRELEGGRRGRPGNGHTRAGSLSQPSPAESSHEAGCSGEFWVAETVLGPEDKAFAQNFPHSLWDDIALW